MKTEQLLKEYEFLKSVRSDLFTAIDSNENAIAQQFDKLSTLAQQDLTVPETQTEFDVALEKVNAYIAMAFLNKMEDHTLELKYITRLSGLVFKIQLNKLVIVHTLKIHGKYNYLTELPPEIGYLQNLRELDLTDSLLTVLPAELQYLHHLRTLKLQGTVLSSVPEDS